MRNQVAMREVIIATLMSGSDSVILRSINICSILYSNCVSSHNYTWSVDNHTYIHRHMYMRAVIYKCLTVTKFERCENHGGSEFLNCNIPMPLIDTRVRKNSHVAILV